jgi:hypothetical protein
MSTGVPGGRTKLSLHGIINRLPQWIRDQYRDGLIESPGKISALQEQFKHVHESWSSVAKVERTTAHTDDIREFDSFDVPNQTRILDRARLYEPYHSLSISLKWFKIDRLTTPQLGIDLDRSAGLLSADQPRDDQAIARLCLDPETFIPKVTVRKARNSLQEGEVELESEDEDVRIHLPPVIRQLRAIDSDPLGAVGPAITFVAAKGAPFVSVAAVPIGGTKARFVVYNGIHRIYRIRELGLEWVPAILVAFPQGNFPASHGDLAGSEIIAPSSTLPLFGDFFNPALIVKIRYRPLTRVLRVRWDYDVRTSPVTPSDE